MEELHEGHWAALSHPGACLFPAQALSMHLGVGGAYQEGTAGETVLRTPAGASSDLHPVF